MTSKTITFNKDLEKFLKENKVKTRFINNLKDRATKDPFLMKPYGNSFKERFAYINKIPFKAQSMPTGIKKCIDHAFNWSDTPEGHEFWSNIARK